MYLEPGSVIRFRHRLWRVDRVTEHEFAGTPLDGRDQRRWRFLRALEEKQVEPGALPRPNPALLSDPAKQDLLLRAYRLSLIHGSAPFLGLQRSRAIPEPYQLVPLLMALGMPKVRLLIGDDVGIGKTIEAGLIVSELFARGEAERMLVVVPATLRNQWEEALSRFFHLDAAILSGTTRPALERRLVPGQSPWEAYPIVVSSVDYLKRRIGEVLSWRWDVVLVDEAHLAARPHAWAGATSTEKERWELLEALGKSPNVRHVVLLTATPHPGHTDCFASLLEVLNPDAVDGHRIRRDTARRHVVQRRRKDIEEWYGSTAPLPRREPPHEEIIALSKAEASLLDALATYGELLQRTDATGVGAWVNLHLQRRALSSPGAIRASLRTRRRAVLKHLARRADETGAARAEAASVVLDQDSTSDLDDERRWERIDTAALSATDMELHKLDELDELARNVTAPQDGKLGRLVELLPLIFQRRAKQPRVLVFTRYKDTLDYVADELDRSAKKKDGKKPNRLRGLRVFRIFGELPAVARRDVFREFERTPQAVCVATDCISEGLDLQRACAELVHYEMPWNPNRLEQRNGRLDRYGQPEPTVGIWSLVREHELDVAVLEVLIRKSAEIRREHGFSPAIFSSERELKRLFKHYGRSRQLELAFDEAEAGEAPDVFDGERIRRIEEESFYGQADVRLPEVEESLRRTYAAVGAPEEIEGFVRSALARARARMTEGEGGVVTVELAGTDLADLGERVRATFDPRAARDDPELELLDVAHPLVRRLVDDVCRSAAGSHDGRVATRGSAGVSEVTAVLHVLARYVAAADPPVVMEELIPLAFRPYSGRREPGDAVDLLRRPAAPLRHLPRELQQMAADALQATGLETWVREALDERRASLAGRHGQIARLAHRWGRGMDEVAIASVDWLALTLLVPA